MDLAEILCVSQWINLWFLEKNFFWILPQEEELERFKDMATTEGNDFKIWLKWKWLDVGLMHINMLRRDVQFNFTKVTFSLEQVFGG